MVKPLIILKHMHCIHHKKKDKLFVANGKSLSFCEKVSWIVNGVCDNMQIN